MSARIRRALVSILAAACLLTAAVPASAMSMEEAEAHTPMAFDALIMRPLGIMALGLGTAIFAISTPMILITRPHEIGGPFHLLVVRPAKYVWADPLGQHGKH